MQSELIKLIERVAYLEGGISLGLSREALLRGSEYDATARPAPAGNPTSLPPLPAKPLAPLPVSPDDFALPGQTPHSAAAQEPPIAGSIHPCPQCGLETARLQERAMDLIGRIVDRRLRQLGIIS